MALQRLLRWVINQRIQVLDHCIAANQHRHLQMLSDRDNLVREGQETEFDLMNRLSYRAYQNMMRETL